jgi:ClpP class serine protease
MINPLLARFADVPALIEPSFARRFEADLAAVVGHEKAGELLSASTALSADDGFWFAPDDWRSAYRPYVVRDGVLQIPVKGVLLHDFPYAFGSWATGYTYIQRALARGLADGNVRGIALIVDSYGGAAASCFDTSDKIFAARGQKPIRAYVETAYSAGYAIGCAADSMTVSKTSGTGSIGVVMTHFDLSRMLEDGGVKVTFIFSGAHKVDGNSYQPLADSVKARWQAWCDASRAEFCALVGRNRGITAAAAAATEAECYRPAEALKLKLIDGVAPLDDAVTAFLDPQQSEESDDPTGDPEMTNPTTASVPAAGAAPAAAAAPAAPAAAAAPAAPAAAAAPVATASTERARIGAILSSEEAKGRTDLANHLAFDTEMSVDAAKAVLAKAPAGQAAGAPAAPVNGFAAAMAEVKNPQVGANADAGAKTDDQKAAELASSIVQAYRGPTAKPAA